MEWTEQLILLTELLGTIAFAFSGAMTAVEKQMDLFGVLVLGSITAVGGGLVRDMILGISPPALFVQPIYICTAAMTALLVFLIIYKRHKLFPKRSPQNYLRLLDFLDAIGLGAFTVVGVNSAIVAGYSSAFLLIFVGVLTGVGGGILRDIMAGVTPTVLRKRVYAIASLVGAALYVYGQPLIGHNAGMAVSAAVIVVIRQLAARYRWDLPVARLLPKE